MSDSFIQLPPDSTGKKTRTNVRTVGVNEVHEEYDILVRSNGEDPFANYSSRVDEASTTVTYYGLAVVGAAEGAAVWQIQKMLVDGTVTKRLWADGNENFDNIWNNRASLSYS